MPHGKVRVVAAFAIFEAKHGDSVFFVDVTNRCSSSKLQSSNLPPPTGALPGQRATQSVGVGLTGLAGACADNVEARPVINRLTTERRRRLFISFICCLCTQCD